jgi:hypothetical protein
MSTKWLPDAGGAKGKDWKWMDFMGEKSLDLFRGETGFADSHILKLLSDTPGFMGGAWKSSLPTNMVKVAGWGPKNNSNSL